ncbi:hypothetical protein GCM10010357_07580 [Streptomyces luteireticuli]|uniref:Long-chain fatty acid--CoA ligase n=1 Tax=Streptomyces luteireticuli TaxID=173858 RepID=A0ABN0YCS5_9ACTN
MENRPEYVAALIAVLSTGRCVVTLSPLEPAARLAEDIHRSSPLVVVGGPDALARPGVLGAVTAQAQAIELGQDGAARTLGGAAPNDGRAGSGAAIEMLTSGTTGPAKRIGLTSRQIDMSLVASGRRPADLRALLSPSVSLVASPMVHIGGLWGVISALHAGRRIVLMTKFALAPWVEAVERHQVQVAFLVPAALRSVLDADVPPERLRSLRLVTSGAAACPVEVTDQFLRRYGIRILTTYGATEFAGAVAGWTYDLHEQWWETKAGSVGRAYGGVELRVTGDDGAELPAGQVGCLEVRTAQSSQGAREWVRTSDQARLDNDGFLWITGRQDDVIVRGGFHIQPATVKRALESHPAVREAAVAGFPDQRLGSVPVAAVEIEPGRRRPTPEELIVKCRAELAPYEVPKRLLVLDALPRTPSSKVSRADLLNLIRVSLGARTQA